MRIRYVGPADQVTLSPNAGGVTFRNGEPVDVDDDLARRLLQQDTFEKAGPVKPPGRGSAAGGGRRAETR